MAKLTVGRGSGPSLDPFHLRHIASLDFGSEFSRLSRALMKSLCATEVIHSCMQIDKLYILEILDIPCWCDGCGGYFSGI